MLGTAAIGSAVPGQAGAADPAWLPGGWIDYAPGGMPDFSQCRPEWSRAGLPGQPGQWTYGGPVAAADVLWWLDSVAEPDPRPPDQPHDGHGLVTAYPAFGPPRDDHSLGNLGPLVEDLAFRLDTDGRRSSRAVRGTAWEGLTAGIAAYVEGRRLGRAYAIETAEAPGAAWLRDRAARGAGIVVLVGVWESQPGGWRWVGGHYVAVAGVATAADAVGLADPLGDAAGLGAPGRATPAGADAHSCRTAPRAHDDAAVVSHDAFGLAADPALPGGRMVLAGYFTPENAGEAAAFQALNPSAATAAHAGVWQHGPVVMAIDAALALVPAAPPATPGGTATATAAAVATESTTPTATAAATATGGATAAATSSATATVGADPTPPRTATVVASRTAEPGSTATPTPGRSPTATATGASARWFARLPRVVRP